MTTHNLTLNTVCKTFGQQKAVNQVHLQLNAGECVGLAGHNGAGKSTLMKLILGLIRADSGEIHLLGENISQKHSIHTRQKMGYLPETVALYPSLTGKETLDFYAKLKGTDSSRNADLLERVGIAQAAKQRVGTYSKGMRQRLALAQALLGSPKLLLLDEPTTGLDPASRQMFYQIIQELKQQGAMVLLSTHALAELDGHADRMVVMKKGNKVADGNLHELHEQSGLPTTISVRLQHAIALPSHWQQNADGIWQTVCQKHEQTQRLHELGQLNTIEYLDIHTPTLDEIYAEFLKREDG